jgi:hypothetical protein
MAVATPVLSMQEAPWREDMVPIACGTLLIRLCMQMFKPRVPFIQWAIPVTRCPVVFHLRFVRRPEDGGLFITVRSACVFVVVVVVVA